MWTASIMIVVGIVWTVLCFFAYTTHPTPSQSNFGILVLIGAALALAGLLWWVWIIAGWLT